MKNHIKTIIAIVVVSVAIWGGAQAEAQTQVKFKNRYSVGFAFTPEWQIGGYSARKFAPSFGLAFDAQFSRHSGFEFGIYDRLFRYVNEDNLIPDACGVVSGVLPLHYREVNVYQHVLLRLGYKFYSDVLNFSVGVDADLATGDKNENSIFEPEAKYVNRNRYGFYVSLSKDITLYKGLILEPDIHINPFFSEQYNRLGSTEYEGMFMGLGVKLKYRF